MGFTFMTFTLAEHSFLVALFLRAILFDNDIFNPDIWSKNPDNFLLNSQAKSYNCSLNCWLRVVMKKIILYHIHIQYFKKKNINGHDDIKLTAFL